MKRSTFLRQSAICVVLMSMILILESFTDLDLLLQRQWFSYETSSWLISKAAHEHWRWLLYGGMKKMVAISGGISCVLMLWGIFTHKPMLVRGGLLFSLSLLITPLVVGMLKLVTDVYCPYELQEFGGQAFYQKVLTMADPANAGLTCGRCFPAGHASGGFAMTMLFFCVPKKLRWPSLALTLGIGWIMGLYQMLRGDHFLSHTLMTMVLAWQINLILVAAVSPLVSWYYRQNTPPDGD